MPASPNTGNPESVAGGSGGKVNGALSPENLRAQQRVDGGYKADGPYYGQITIYTVLEHEVANFDRLISEVAREVYIREPGVFAYIVHTAPSAPLQRIIYALYRDRVVYEAHQNQPHIRKFEAERRPYVLATNTIEVLPRPTNGFLWAGEWLESLEQDSRVQRTYDDDRQAEGRYYGQITIYTLLDAGAADFDRLINEAAREIYLRETGVFAYIVLTIPSAPLQRIIYALYRDRIVYEEHQNQPHIRKFEAERRPYVLATNIIEIS
jgi:quinol monooxygenase YgiN